MTILEAQHDLPAFRQAIRDWLAEVVPADWKARMARASNEEFIAFQRWWMAERSKVGLAIPHWPKEYGGAGLTLRHLIVIADEMARADAPQARMFTISLIHHSRHAVAARDRGAEAPLSVRRGQRRSLVPGILRAELRIRPRVVALPGGSRWRSLRDQRAKDLVVVFDVRRPLPVADPDRSECAKAPRHHLFHHGHAFARRRGAADPAGQRPRRSSARSS